MGKRKQSADKSIDNGHGEGDGSSSEEDFDTVNVDFEWFDPQPEYDYHGIKTLLQQLLDIDSQLFDLSAITDLILAQPLLGSTVKVEGNHTDAYAFLSVLNLEIHHEKPFVSKLTQYIKGKANSRPALAKLSNLLGQPSTPCIGLILTERLINVPAEVVPPMYTMLLEEIQWALEEKEPFTFTHYLIVSKTYTEIVSKLDEEDDRPKKKTKAQVSSETFYFHPEDEIFQRHADCYGGFDYSTKHDDGHSDSKRAFQEMGIKPQGHMILIEASRFQDAVKDVADFLKPSS